ncbi:hypothetical protein D3C85_1700350 [compost metagenome]
MQRQFVKENSLLAQAPARAAMLLGPGRSDPAPAMQVLLPIDILLLFEFFAVQDFAADVLGQVRLGEAADFLAEFPLLRRDFKIHVDIRSRGAFRSARWEKLL